MSRALYVLGILLIYLRLTIQTSSVDSSTYAAGVVQYEPLNMNVMSGSLVSANIDNYYFVMKAAQKLNLDIIVFPENGLNALPSGFLPDKPPSFVKYNSNGTANNVDDDYENNVSSYSKTYRKFFQQSAFVLPVNYTDRVLCPHESIQDVMKKGDGPIPVLELMSCCARFHFIYVVVTHYELENCVGKPNCPPDGYFFYSTTVVFDRSGKIAARYRKHTRYDEPWIDLPRSLEPVTFATDFGVTFGLLTGLDILDSRIADYYARELEVTDVILSTYQFDMPFLVSARDQMALVKDDMNLLVAGRGWDSDAGIYTGSNETMARLAGNKTYNSIFYKNVTKVWRRIPENQTSEELKVHMLNEVPSMDEESVFLGIMPSGWTLRNFSDNGSFAVLQVNPNRSIQFKQDSELCVDTFCCRFSIYMSYYPFIKENDFFYTYSAVALRAMHRLINGTVVSIELCALVACKNSSDASCGESFIAKDNLVHPWTIKNLVINREDKLKLLIDNMYVPLALTDNATVLREDEFTYSEKPESPELGLNKPRKNLRIFGILNRILEAKKLPPEYYTEQAGGRSMWLEIISLVMVILGIVSCVLPITLRNKIGSYYRGDEEEECPFSDDEYRVTFDNDAYAGSRFDDLGGEARVTIERDVTSDEGDSRSGFFRQSRLVQDVMPAYARKSVRFVGLRSEGSSDTATEDDDATVA